MTGEQWQQSDGTYFATATINAVFELQQATVRKIEQALDDSAAEFAELIGLEAAEIAKLSAVCRRPDVEDNTAILRWYFENEEGVRSREYTLDVDFILK